MKRAANYKKLALVERAELDRLRQKQLKEYNPILSQLASIQAEIERVLRTNQLAIEDRLGVLTLLHSRFDNLYKTLKYNGGLAISAGADGPVVQPVAAAFATPLAAAPLFAGAAVAPAFAIQPPAPHGIAGPREAEPDLMESIQDRDEPPAPEAIPQFAGDGRPPPNFESRSMQTPAPVIFPEIKDLKIAPNFENKYAKLVEMLSPYPHIINISETGEIVLHGKTIPTSNFKDLLTSLFQHKENLNLEGEDEFIDALRDLDITEKHLSSMQSKSKIAHSPSSNEPASLSKYEDAPSGMSGEGRVRKRKSHHSSLSTKVDHVKKSKSRLDPKKLGPPPGTRPRILRLYR